jgi:A/G-specific adenine glycosylase
MFNEYAILTSERIQRQYFDVVKRRTEIEVIDEYLLVSVANFKGNVNIIEKNVCRNEKNVFPWMEDADDLRAKVYHQNLAGAFNQALMELGATICVPNGAPLCTECPWKDFCEAKKQELIGQIPVKSKAKPRKIEKKTVLILRDDEKVAIRKRPAKGLLAGLYELPNVEGNMGQEEVLSMVKEMGYAPIRIQPLGEAKHIFSHIEWHMTGYAVRVEEPEMHPQVQCEKNRADGLLFVEAEDAKEKYAIPSAFAAYAKYMNILLGNEKKA